MDKITINLTEKEVMYLKTLLLDDAFKTRKKLDESINENNKETIIKCFNFITTNNSISTKIICGEEK